MPEKPRDWNAEITATFRANNGIVPAPYENPPPMLLVHTWGRKTGKDHVTPMRCMIHDGQIYIFASAHGSPKQPDWYLNLVANAVIHVEIGTEQRTYQATVLEEQERDHIWNVRVTEMPAFADLQTKAGDRLIPVIRLDAPARSTGAAYE
jgi:deazaflavin-dependent oxidoreductase (nitroreductase family)